MSNNTNLDALKSLAVCLGCAECTADVTATTNAEAIKFICDHLHSMGGEVTNITLDRNKKGVVVSGTWTDSKGTHDITLY